MPHRLNDVFGLPVIIPAQGVAKIVRDVYISQSSSMHFSMMSLGPPA
jgi:hypothetical protein